MTVPKTLRNGSVYRALQIDHSLYDAKYSKGFCYEELGDFQKAYDVWCEIADDLKTEGYKIEAKFPMELAKKMQGKIDISQQPHCKQRGIKFAVPQAAGYATLAAFAKYPRKQGYLAHRPRESVNPDKR